MDNISGTYTESVGQFLETDEDSSSSELGYTTYGIPFEPQSNDRTPWNVLSTPWVRSPSEEMIENFLEGLDRQAEDLTAKVQFATKLPLIPFAEGEPTMQQWLDHMPLLRKEIAARVAEENLFFNLVKVFQVDPRTGRPGLDPRAGPLNGRRAFVKNVVQAHFELAMKRTKSAKTKYSQADELALANGNWGELAPKTNRPARSHNPKVAAETLQQIAQQALEDHNEISTNLIEAALSYRESLGLPVDVTLFVPRNWDARRDLLELPVIGSPQCSPVLRKVSQDFIRSLNDAIKLSKQ